MKRTYIVAESIPGYLPDTEPVEFTNRREAGRYALTLARELRGLGYVVKGNMRIGYYAERDADDLGRIITITESYAFD